MVGVPGRSKGCNTCIQRKVKCDGGQPTCNNCRKGSRVCTGYKRLTTFVLSSNMSLVPDTVAQKDTSDVGTSSTRVLQGRWHKPEPRSTPVAEAARDQELNVGPQSANTTASVDTGDSADLSMMTGKEIKRFRKKCRPKQTGAAAVPRSGNGSRWGPTAAQDVTWMLANRASVTKTLASDAVWCEQLFPTFLQTHMPADLLSSSLSAQGSAGSARNWLLQAQRSGVTEVPALESAMAAIVLGRVGRRHGHPVLVQQSLQAYTRSLRQLQTALRSDATRLSDHTLATCMALSMYEVSECPTENVSGYNAHQAGGLVLLQTRGPRANLSPLGHALVVFMRSQHVRFGVDLVFGKYSTNDQFLISLTQRKSTFFSHNEWMSTRWSSTTKHPQDQFMDQMYDIPVLLEQADKLDRSTADPATLAHGFLRITTRYRAFYKCLRGWVRAMQVTVGGPLYWPELATLQLPEDIAGDKPRVFPVAFRFPVFIVGQSLLLFWAVAVVINQNIAVLYRRLAALQDAAGGTMFLDGGPVDADAFPCPTSYMPDPGSAPGSASGSVPVSLSGPSPTASPATLASMPADTATNMPPRTRTRTPASSGVQSMVCEQLPAMTVSLASMSASAFRAAAAEAEAINMTVLSNICQSMEYFLTPENGDLGRLAILLPLVLIRSCLERLQVAAYKVAPSVPSVTAGPKEMLQWVDFVLQRVGDGGGQRMASFLGDYS